MSFLPALAIQHRLPDHSREYRPRHLDDKKVYIVPLADAVINPKQADCDYPFKLLCGAGVAYKLISLLYDRLGLDKKELEDAILNYNPTIIFVEHDEKFIEKVATKIINLVK